MKLPLEEIARHEIGHAIVCLALGYPIREVSLIPDRHSWGRCLFSLRFPRAILRPGRFQKEQAMIRVAGYMAQCLHHKRELSVEYHVAEWVLTRDQFADDPEEFDRICGQTWAILNTPEHRTAAGLMLKALMKYKRLTGRQVQRIYDRARKLENYTDERMPVLPRSFGIELRQFAGNGIGVYLRRLWGHS